MLDGQHAVEAALVERVDDTDPVDLAEAGYAVAPPADVPGVNAVHRDAGVAVPVALVGEDLGVLRLGVGHLVDVRLDRRYRVDTHPQQVRGVVVQVQPEGEHPLPQLRGVREVAGVAVGVPALHDAVLDNELDPLLAGPVDQRREDLLGRGQVLNHGAARVAPNERADGRAAQQGGRVDQRQHMLVNGGTLDRVGVQVVVVERQ